MKETHAYIIQIINQIDWNESPALVRGPEVPVVYLSWQESYTKLTITIASFLVQYATISHKSTCSTPGKTSSSCRHIKQKVQTCISLIPYNLRFNLFYNCLKFSYESEFLSVKLLRSTSAIMRKWLWRQLNSYFACFLWVEHM